MILAIEDTDSFYGKLTTALAEGRIISLPTDTTYGLAVDGTNAEAVKRLMEIKGRSERPFAIFVSKNRISTYAQIVKRKIVEYFIPGKLTVVMRKQEDVSLPFINDKVGVRVPDLHFIVKLLSRYDKPLAVTSANMSGHPPMRTATEIAEEFTGVALVVHGGMLLSPPSTVLDITETPPLVLRKGAVSILEIENVYGGIVRLEPGLRFHVLFVCSGNTCRSPMAAGIFRTLVHADYCEVRSAGTLFMGGSPASDHALAVVREYGGSIADHEARSVSKELIAWADLIFVMSYKHYDRLVEVEPGAVKKTFLLKEYKRKVKYTEVADPVGQDISAYRITARDMMPSLRLIARDVKRRFGKG